MGSGYRSLGQYVIQSVPKQLDGLIRRYEARKNENGQRETLGDDIKCTAIELLVPTDLKKHLILNKSRLTSYSLIKQEIEVLIETMLGSKGKIHRPGSADAAASNQGPAPMEVDSFATWLGSLVKGKGKGKGGKGTPKGGKSNDKDMTCYNIVKRDTKLRIVGVRKRMDLKAQKMEKGRKAQAKAQAMARKEKERESIRNMHRPLMRPQEKKMPSMKRVMNRE